MKKQRILPAETPSGGLAESLLRQWRGGGEAATAYAVTRRSVDAEELARLAVKRSLADNKIQND